MFTEDRYELRLNVRLQSPPFQRSDQLTHYTDSSPCATMDLYPVIHVPKRVWNVTALHAHAVKILKEVFRGEVTKFHNQGIKLEWFFADRPPELLTAIGQAQDR